MGSSFRRGCTRPAGDGPWALRLTADGHRKRGPGGVKRGPNFLVRDGRARRGHAPLTPDVHLDHRPPRRLRVRGLQQGGAGQPDDVKAPPADAKKTDSGLAYKVLKPGTGKEKPTPADTVEVHYTGWTTDGRMFDSSVKRGQPAHFPVGAVIKGWTEGLQLMTVGEKTRFWIPAGLAYGDTPGGGRPAGMLVFDVELLGITAPPKTPEDVAAPPKSTKKTKSGIAYRVLKKGTGKEHPTAQSTVEVHYSG